MKNAISTLPPEHRLQRKEVCYYLQWSRTTLWRRESEGLRFVCGEIELATLLDWLRRRQEVPQRTWR